MYNIFTNLVRITETFRRQMGVAEELHLENSLALKRFYE